MYRYEMHWTGGSSDRFGNCDVCHQPVRKVFYQIEERAYTPPHSAMNSQARAQAQEDQLDDPGYWSNAPTGWTRRGCTARFGHPACLRRKRGTMNSPMTHITVDVFDLIGVLAALRDVPLAEADQERVQRLTAVVNADMDHKLALPDGAIPAPAAMRAFLDYLLAQPGVVYMEVGAGGWGRLHATTQTEAHRVVAFHLDDMSEALAQVAQFWRAG